MVVSICQFPGYLGAFQLFVPPKEDFLMLATPCLIPFLELTFYWPTSSQYI